MKQRYVCQTCGYRFTFPSSLNNVKDNMEGSQISANQLVKNLEPKQKHKFCEGDIKQVNADIKGLLTQFYAYLEREAYSSESDYVDKEKHRAVLGAHLKDPENVKDVISKMTYTRNGETRPS